MNGGRKFKLRESRQEWLDGFMGRYRMTCFRLKVCRWELERVARSAGHCQVIRSGASDEVS